MIQTKQRVLYFDILLFYCIFQAIFVHVEPHFCAETTSIWWDIFIGGGPAAVIMCSGAKVLPLRESGSRFLRRRLRSFIVPLLLWSIVYLLLTAYVAHDTRYFADRRLIWMLFTPTFGAGWFLYALIGVYLFAPFISPWIGRASRHSVECFLGIWLLSGLIPFASQHVEVNQTILPFAPFATYVGYYVAGYYLNRWPVRERSRKEKLQFCAFVLIVGVLLGLWFARLGVRYGYCNIFMQDTSINMMAMCMLMFAVAEHIRHVPRVVNRCVGLIARNSLQIYLCHVAVLEYIVMPMGYGMAATYALTALISVALGTALTRLSIRCVDGVC
jgi:surface polysaccharide O-acyltransferase-like enzyme